MCSTQSCIIVDGPQQYGVGVECLGSATTRAENKARRVRAVAAVAERFVVPTCYCDENGADIDHGGALVRRLFAPVVRK